MIYKIALNLAASRRRSKRVWRWVSFDTIRAPSSADEPADDAISSRQELGRLRRAVERLPDDLRRVIMLCEYSELSYDEIAGIMSIPAGTVGSRRHSAIQRLRETLSEAPTRHD